ncbi:MAG TPA: PqqD family protein [Bacillaceae bacterium]
MNTLSPDSIIDCSHLSIQPEGDEFTVGDPVIGEFIRVPEVAIDVIRMLDGQATVEEVRRTISQKYEEDVDVLDFAQVLQDCHLILSIDGHLVHPEMKRNPNPILVKLGNVFFSPVAVFLYFLAFASIIVFLMARPALFPGFKDLFIYEAVGISGLTVLLVTWIHTLIHEMAHLLAASKENILARIRLNLRMVWLVAETDMTGLWSLPKSKRYIPFLAGMMWDCIMILGCFIIQMTAANQMLIAYSRMAAFIIILSFLWQFIIFLRTDIYFVVSAWKNTSALHDSSLMYLKKIFLKKESAEWDLLPQHEKKNAAWFGLLYITGGAVALGLFLHFQLQPALYALYLVYKNLANQGIESFYFWDSILVLAVLMLQIITWMVGFRTYLNERRERRQQAIRAN